MPSSKKSKEATWTEKELLKAIQQDDSKRRSDGGKRRSVGGEKDKKRPLAEHGESSKTEGKEGERRHRDKEKKTSEEETHRKHKEKEKHRSDRKSDGDKHRSDRKSDGDKPRSDRKADGDKHKSDRKEEGERHRTDRKSHGEPPGDTIFDQDIIEHRSLVNKDKHRRVSLEDKEKKKPKKDEKERSVEKERRGSEKVSKKDRSSDKKEHQKSKESKQIGDDVGKKVNLNETYDLEALKETQRKHKEAKDGKRRDKPNEGEQKKHKEDSHSKDSKRDKSSSEKHSTKQKDKGSKSQKKEDRKREKRIIEIESRRSRDDRNLTETEGHCESSDNLVIPVEECGLLFSDTIDRAYEFVAVASEKNDAIKEEEGDDYGYDDDDFEDYDDDDFEEDDGEDDNDDVEEEDDDYTDDNDTKTSDNKLSIKNSSSAHEVDEMVNDAESDIKAFSHKKKSSDVKLNSLRDSAEGKRTTHTENLDMNEVLKSISAENERVSSGTSSQNNSRPSTGTEIKEKAVESPKPAKKVFGKINFVAAKQKQLNEKTAKKTKKRGQELLELVQLDQRFIDLFDMPPMTEYELYMKRFGQSGYTQMYTQTHDDDITQTTQTEEIETTSKWCQCSHDMKSCGNKRSQEERTDDDHKDNSHTNGPLNINSARLNKFLIKAGQVVLSLFNELDAGIEQHQRQYTESRTQFSEGYVTLASADFLVLGISDAAAPSNCAEVGRAFTHVTYSSSQTNMLLAAYGDCKLERSLKNAPKGMIAVWNTNDPTRPTAYLLCESLPTSCCFTSSHSSLVFAGMEDGVIAVWDLNEPASYHKECVVGESKEIFRSTTFTTAALQENHEYPIVAISPILSSSSGGLSQKNDGIDMSFQLVSLDQSGILNIWIVVEAHIDTTDFSNVHEDLGLSPCGCIKLSRSATINTLSSIYSSFESLFSATCFQVDLMRPNDVYVGTDQGIIVHALRFGSRPIPKSYKPSKGSGSKVNSIDVSPWKLPYFIACYEDGSVSLFHNQKETSVRTWESFSKGEAIIDVRWSRSRPGTFFAIDAQSVFYIWDILQSDVQPIFTQMMMRKDKRAVGFSLANDYSSIGIGTPGRSAEMMLMYGDGSIEIHRLSKTLSIMDADELDRVTEYMDDIIPT